MQAGRSRFDRPMMLFTALWAFGPREWSVNSSGSCDFFFEARCTLHARLGNFLEEEILGDRKGGGGKGGKMTDSSQKSLSLLYGILNKWSEPATSGLHSSPSIFMPRVARVPATKSQVLIRG